MSGLLQSVAIGLGPLYDIMVLYVTYARLRASIEVYGNLSAGPLLICDLVVCDQIILIIKIQLIISLLPFTLHLALIGE